MYLFHAFYHLIILRIIEPCDDFIYFNFICSDVTGMASSSVSQEDFDNDYELTSRRSRIRTARARVIPPRTGQDMPTINFQSMYKIGGYKYYHLFSIDF